jgi:plastocyanin
MKTFAFTLAALLAAVALVGAGCGGDDGDADTTPTETTETTTTDTTDTTDTTETTETDDTTTETGSALRGSVGPGFDISLSTADGSPASTVDPGSYELEVEDLSSAHNFHLAGPGVDVSTEVAEEGTQTFSVELTTGTYSFVCDPHAGAMFGSFIVP